MYFYKQTKQHPLKCGLRLMAATLALLLCLPLTAGGDKKAEKAYQKQCKKEIRRLQSEGWKVYGTPQTLEQVLMPYYMELADNAQYIHVQQEDANFNVALSKAKLMAQKMYGEAIESSIKAEIETEMANVDSGDGVKSEERFHAVLRQRVEQHIKGFVPRFTLIREAKNGHTEVQQFYTYKLTD